MAHDVRVSFLRYGNQIFLADCHLFCSVEDGPLDRLSCGAAWIAEHTPRTMPLLDSQGTKIATMIIPDPIVDWRAPVLMGDRDGAIEFELVA